LYGAQEPRHLAAAPPPALGGPALQGISLYRSDTGNRPHTHLISYGMSELYYEPEAADGDVSGWCFEFTARVALSDEGDPLWMCNVLQNLAGYVVRSGRWFEPGHFIPANGPIWQGSKTTLTAFAFARDTELGSIDTPHGRVDFIQVAAIDDACYQDLRAHSDGHYTLSVLERIRESDPLLIIDVESGS
jgi:hypothetical protein